MRRRDLDRSSRYGSLRSVARASLLLVLVIVANGCGGIGLPFALPFAATPTPQATPVPTPPPPTPVPTPARLPVEIEIVQFIQNDAGGPLFLTVVFRLRNPNVHEFVQGVTVSGRVTTPDGRLLPLAKPAIAAELAPGEQKWFAIGGVDTFGSLVGKVELTVSGGQWLPANIYPYPGGVPITVKRAEKQRENPVNAVDYDITNTGELGIRGNITGFAFDAKADFVGTISCPSQLWPARKVVTVACAVAAPPSPARVVFTTYADLRPVLVIPTATPTLAPGQTPAPPTAPPSPTPAGGAASPTPAATPVSPAATGSPPASPTKSP